MLRLIFCVLCLTACGAGAPPPLGDPPFSAAQVRDATPPGRRYRFKVTPAGQPTQFQVIEFIEVNAQNAKMRQRALDAAGQPTGDEVITLVSWEELESHGRFPAAQTRIAPERIKTPAGEFDCWRYTVTRDDEIVRSWFAHDLPGAPVKQEVSKRGLQLLRMELVDHYPGKR